MAQSITLVGAGKREQFAGGIGIFVYRAKRPDQRDDWRELFVARGLDAQQRSVGENCGVGKLGLNGEVFVFYGSQSINHSACRLRRCRVFAAI